MPRIKIISKRSDKDAGRNSTAMPDGVGEEHVLKPVSKDQHPDDWPCFVLRNAVIYGKDGKSLGNLLNSELDGPFTIRGTLDVDKDLSYLQTHGTSKVTVNLANVVGFSIADGPITLWASGKSGWFEIKPSPLYKTTYNKMVEGIKLYYFLVDIYEENKTRKKASSSGNHMLTMDRIFHEYIQQSEVPITKPQAAQHCMDHATFLLSQMRKESAHVRWARRNIYQWLRENCPETFARYEPKETRFDPGLTTGASKRKDSLAASDQRAAQSLIAQKVQTKIISIATDTVFSFIKDLHNTKILRRQHMTIPKLSKALYESFDLASEEFAEELLRTQAKPLSVLLAKDWETSQIRQKFLEISNESQVSSSDICVFAHRTKLAPSRGQHQSSSATIAEPQILHRQHEATRQTRRKRQLDDEGRNGNSHNRSAASTRGDEITNLMDINESERGNAATSKTSKSDKQNSAAVSRRKAVDLTIIAAGQSSDTQVERRDWESVSAPSSRRRISRAGKRASLRLFRTIPNEGAASPAPSEEESHPTRSSKRQKRLPSPGPADEEDGMTDDNPYNEYRDADYPYEEEPEIKMELEVVSERLPSATPQGPRGLWICQRSGCGYEVPGADKVKGRRQVQAHFLEHAEEIEAREQLILQESRPHLPIDNLLEKIRSIGQAARLADQAVIGGRTVPLPIHRRLAV